MKQRNPNATCGTCPYWELSKAQPERNVGTCNKGHGECDDTYGNHWCGEHPDFWVEEKTDRKMDCRTVTCEQAREIEAAISHRDAVIARLVEAVSEALQAGPDYCTMADDHLGILTVAQMKKLQSALYAAKEISND